MKVQSGGTARGRGASNKTIALLSVLLLATILLALMTFIHVAQRDAFDEQYLLRASEQRILSQRIAKFALAAAGGDQDDADQYAAGRHAPGAETSGNGQRSGRLHRLHRHRPPLDQCGNQREQAEANQQAGRFGLVHGENTHHQRQKGAQIGECP